MTLSNTQLAQMESDGYLALPSLFDADEVELLRGAVPEVLVREGPEVIREAGDASIVRMVFAAHTFNDAFRRLTLHPRLLSRMEQLFGEPAYLFQSRFNVKSGFHSAGWAWHQDFNQWHRLDGMQTPNAMAVGVFLDDVNPCNGPVMVIPGSHKRGHIFNPVAMDIPDADVAAAANDLGIIPLMGPPGTVVIFHSLIIHGSAPNVSPWPRRIFYMNVSPISNRELHPNRPLWHCDAGGDALVPLDDDCLRMQVRA
jgi:ectoine hydroxylase